MLNNLMYVYNWKVKYNSNQNNLSKILEIKK